MATKIISIFMVLLSFWTLAACRQGNATRIKSNTPDAPMSMIDGLAGRRIRRGTSGSQLTYQERIDFLKSHNDYRANTNPMASDMQFMVSRDLFTIKLIFLFQFYTQIRFQN